jgi:hypothetical protein
MKKALVVAAISLALAGSAFAAEGDNAQTFEQKKAEMLKKIENRINKMQEDRSCVQSAKDHDSLKACNEKRKKMIEEEKKGKAQ